MRLYGRCPDEGRGSGEMRGRVLMPLVACAAVAVCAGAGPQAPSLDLSAGERAEIVRAHNEWRARVGVRPVRWSAELAAGAERWAVNLARRGCRLSHSSEDAGENLFWASPVKATGREPAVNPLTPTMVVDSWGAESQFYSYARNSCARGKKCGHYVQIVWSATTEIGCGASICRDRGQVWVCRYRPGVMDGKRPY